MLVLDIKALVFAARWLFHRWSLAQVCLFEPQLFFCLLAVSNKILCCCEKVVHLIKFLIWCVLPINEFQREFFIGNKFGSCLVQTVIKNEGTHLFMKKFVDVSHFQERKTLKCIGILCCWYGCIRSGKPFFNLFNLLLVSVIHNELFYYEYFMSTHLTRCHCQTSKLLVKYNVLVFQFR